VEAAPHLVTGNFLLLRLCTFWMRRPATAIGLLTCEDTTSAWNLGGLRLSAVRTGVSQVAAERQGRRDAFLATSFQAVQASQTILRTSSRTPG
jgi:hypothetical protein